MILKFRKRIGYYNVTVKILKIIFSFINIISFLNYDVLPNLDNRFVFSKQKYIENNYSHSYYKSNVEQLPNN